MATFVSASSTPVKASSRRAGTIVGLTMEASPRSARDFRTDLTHLVATGATWMRFGIQFWDMGTWNQGRWTWDQARSAFFTDCVRQARRAGLRISLTLAQMLNGPQWSQAEYLAVNREYWARCMRTVAAGGGVDVVQVYNEADHNHFRTLADLGGTMTPSYLSDLASAIHAAGQEAHAVLPHALVTTNVVDGGDAHWETFYDTVAAATDVIGVNCYPGDDEQAIHVIPFRLERLRQRYAKQALVTEIGVPTETGGPIPVASARRVLPQMIGSAAQADPLAVLVYELRNQGRDPRNPEDNFGIFTYDQVRRPTYDAVVSAIHPY